MLGRQANVDTLPIVAGQSATDIARRALSAAKLGGYDVVMLDTAGRTTLAGEGLQHQDGHSHLLDYPVPNLLAYDPAFAYEIAVIVQDGIRRMYKDGENIFYYITVMNEQYAMPAMPGDVVTLDDLQACLAVPAAQEVR